MCPGLCCHFFFLQLWYMLSLNLPAELLYADDLVPMSDSIKGLGNKFFKYKVAFMSKGLKVNLGKTNLVVNVNITKDGMSKSKVDPCVVCSLRAKANSVFFCNVISGSIVDVPE